MRTLLLSIDKVIFAPTYLRIYRIREGQTPYELKSEAEFEDWEHSFQLTFFVFLRQLRLYKQQMLFGFLLR